MFASPDPRHLSGYIGLAREGSVRMWCVITVIIGATSCCTVTSCMISEISVSVIMSMTRVSENDVMFMVLQLILLQGELLAVMAAPEEPLLIVEIWSEFARPD